MIMPFQKFVASPFVGLVALLKHVQEKSQYRFSRTSIVCVYYEIPSFPLPWEIRLPSYKTKT